FKPVAASDAADWQRALCFLAFPEGWVSWIDAKEAHHRTGVRAGQAGIWHAAGHLVYPWGLLEGLLAHDAIVLKPKAVQRLQRETGGDWLAYDASEQLLASAPVCVLATAGRSGAVMHQSGLALPDRL